MEAEKKERERRKHQTTIKCTHTQNNKMKFKKKENKQTKGKTDKYHLSDYGKIKWQIRFLR